MNKANKKLDILMVADYFFPDEVGGSRRYIYDISRELAKKGHNVHVLVKRARKELPQEELINGVTIHRYNIINSKISLFPHYTYIFGAFFACNKLIKKIKFDLINFHHSLSAIGVNLSIFSRNIPKVYTNHSLWVDELKIELSFHKKTKKFFHKWFITFLFWLRILESTLVENFNLNRCNKIWVLSEYNKALIVKIHRIPEAKIEVIPGGVDVDRFQSGNDKKHIRKELDIPADKFIIMAAGRLVFRKGFDNLIKAMPGLIKKFKKKPCLLILGGGRLEEKLKDLVKNLKLEKYIDFVGEVNNEKIPLYYRSSDLFVIPSMCMEPFGLVILEALSSGTPVLGTPIGGIKEILSKFDKRLLFDGVDPTSISKLIEYFISSDSEYKDIKGRCRDYVLKNYSWNIIATKIEDLYYTVLGCRSD